jgi:hypothetical protein
MVDAIGEVLPWAVAVAISPIPIIAVILMLFTPKANTNGPAFLVGWVVGLSLVAGIIYSLADGADAATDPDAASGVGWGKVILGLLLLFLALKQWRGRPGPGETPTMPDWMDGIDDFTPVKSLGLGVALSAANPKNLIITAGAAASIAESGLSSGDAAVVIAVFVVLASLSVAGLVAYRLFGGDGARESLDRLQAWLGIHNAAVMTAILAVIGAKLIGDGLGGI